MGVASCFARDAGTAIGGFQGSSIGFGLVCTLGLGWGGLECFLDFPFRVFFQNGFIPHPPFPELG